MVQLELELLDHKVGAAVVPQRQKDGFIDATKMCVAAGKRWSHYRELTSTQAFIDELSSSTGIPAAELIQSLVGGSPHLQGTWIHPQVAIHLAQWLSPKFAVMVTQWVYDWMSGKGQPKPVNLPFHLRRYVQNQRNVPKGHFSVLNEIGISLIGPLEADGYTMPEKLWPDISQGMMFAKWLREVKGVDTNSIPTYTHEFEDGRASVQAKAYPNAWLGEFRDHFENVWMPQRAIAYFKERDTAALEYLPKILGLEDKG